MKQPRIRRIRSLTFELMFGKHQPLMTVIAPVHGAVRISLECQPLKMNVEAMLAQLTTGHEHLCFVESDDFPPDKLASFVLKNRALRVGPGYQFDAELIFD